MAKFFFEMQRQGFEQDKYLVNDREGASWIDWEYTDGVSFVEVNSQLKNEHIAVRFGQQVKDFMALKGLTKVRINMVRNDESAMSLSRRYTVFRRWNVVLEPGVDLPLWHALAN